MKIRVKATITLERDYPSTTDVRTVFLDVCESLKLLNVCESPKLNTFYRTLTFKGREVELSQKLSDLGVKEGEYFVLKPVTVGMLKKRICRERGIDPNTVRIAYRGRALRDEELLEDLGLKDGDKLVIVTRTIGRQTFKVRVENGYR